MKYRRLYLAGCCGSVSAGVGSCLSSSEETGAGAGVGAGAGFEAGAGVVVEPESCTGGLGASETGGEAAAAGLAYLYVKKMYC